MKAVAEAAAFLLGKSILICGVKISTLNVRKVKNSVKAIVKICVV